MAATTFDPQQYKITTGAQWEDAVDAWHRWGQVIEDWLGDATERMLEAANITAGSRVLDVAAGAGDFPDQQAALTGMWRALRPGGRLSAVVYSTADRNEFFSIPIGIIRRRAQLPPPQPGQPGPFSLGSPGVAEKTLVTAGFRDVAVETVPSPLRLASAADCLEFERQSFGALHQMLSGLPQADRDAAWDKISQALAQFEEADGFVGPCEMLVVSGTR